MTNPIEPTPYELRNILIERAKEVRANLKLWADQMEANAMQGTPEGVPAVLRLSDSILLDSITKEAEKLKETALQMRALLDKNPDLEAEHSWRPSTHE